MSVLQLDILFPFSSIYHRQCHRILEVPGCDLNILYPLSLFSFGSQHTHNTVEVEISTVQDRNILTFWHPNFTFKF